MLVERGLPDPHRDGCEDCARAHASRQELIEAIPLIGAGHTGDPHWQAKVWRRIDDERAPAPWRWRWQLAGALALVSIVALWLGLGRSRPGDVLPRIEIIEGGVAMRSIAAHDRSIAAHVDARLRVTVNETSEVWIYRLDHLVRECRAQQVANGCVMGADGMVVGLLLRDPVTYRVIIVDAARAPRPSGVLDEDLAVEDRQVVVR